MIDSLKRYELFGWDYARYSPLNEAEVGWYLFSRGIIRQPGHLRLTFHWKREGRPAQF